MSEKQIVIEILNSQGIDMNTIINEIFLGYKFRKWRGKLYNNDNMDLIKNLIKTYYLLNPNEVEFNNIKKAFVKNYVKNESELEGINDETIHGIIEMQGLYEMYNYIFSGEISKPNYEFSIYDLKELHKKLFSKFPHPECAGIYRTMFEFLPGTGTELCDACLINRELYNIDKEIIQPLVYIGKNIKNGTISLEEFKLLKLLAQDNSPIPEEKITKADILLLYLDACVILGCKLIKVHPFVDGNGRTVRGFMNKLMTDVGLPPTYVKATERTKYHEAINKANREVEYKPDYTDIKNFYLYKICDSIVELDINEKIKTANQNLNNNLESTDNEKQYSLGKKNK